MCGRRTKDRVEQYTAFALFAAGVMTLVLLAPFAGRDVDVLPVEHHVQRPEQAERPHFH